MPAQIRGFLSHYQQVARRTRYTPRLLGVTRIPPSRTPHLLACPDVACGAGLRPMFGMLRDGALVRLTPSPSLSVWSPITDAQIVGLYKADKFTLVQKVLCGD